jgi:hypothetical protein
MFVHQPGAECKHREGQIAKVGNMPEAVQADLRRDLQNEKTDCGSDSIEGMIVHREVYIFPSLVRTVFFWGRHAQRRLQRACWIPVIMCPAEGDCHAHASIEKALPR